MLLSRSLIWQHVTELILAGFQAGHPALSTVCTHPDPLDIAYADRQALHGNFRNWAQLTAHVVTALERTGRDHPV
ncbi:hypothetical protein [Streptomyces sp. LMG1-1-1.1]|uniref:hypothetical protein n=1 Tax=Streptomyces sp. LMG1-1-1.1 TaxID=3135245 RepID=UPI003466115C